MALSLPYTLAAGSPENVNQVQANFDAIANSFPLSVNTSNFSAVPQCRVTKSAVQSIPNNALTAITFNTETYDTGTPSNNMHDTSSNTERIVCRVAGLYLITGAIAWAAAATGDRVTAIHLNGTTYIGSASTDGTTASNTTTQATSLYRLAVNDYVVLHAYQTSGGSLNTYETANPAHTHFQAVMVSV